MAVMWPDVDGNLVWDGHFDWDRDDLMDHNAWQQAVSKSETEVQSQPMAQQTAVTQSVESQPVSQSESMEPQSVTMESESMSMKSKSQPVKSKSMVSESMVALTDHDGGQAEGLGQDHEGEERGDGDDDFGHGDVL